MLIRLGLLFIFLPVTRSWSITLVFLPLSLPPTSSWQSTLLSLTSLLVPQCSQTKNPQLRITRFSTLPLSSKNIAPQSKYSTLHSNFHMWSCPARLIITWCTWISPTTNWKLFKSLTGTPNVPSMITISRKKSLSTTLYWFSSLNADKMITI